MWIVIYRQENETSITIEIAWQTFDNFDRFEYEA